MFDPRRAIPLSALLLVVAGCGARSETSARAIPTAAGGVAGTTQTVTATAGAIGDGTLDIAGDLQVTPGGHMDPADAEPAPGEAVGAAAECPDREATQRAVGADRYREGIACMLNAMRTDRGLRTLRDDRRLERAGARHSREMVEKAYFSHLGHKGSTLVTRDTAAGYPLKSSDSWSVGETLAWSTGALETPRAVVNAWMRSTGHRRILLQAGWRDVGIGTALGIPSDAAVGITVAAEFGAHSAH